MDVYKGAGLSKSAQGETGWPPAKPLMIATEATNPQRAPAAAQAPVPTEPSHKYWHTVGEMRRLFQTVRERIGEVTYLQVLERCNVQSVDDFLKIRPALAGAETASRCYANMLEIAERGAA